MVLLVLSMIPFNKFRYNKLEREFFINFQRIDHIEYALKAGLRPLEAERKMADMVDSKIMKGIVYFAKPLYIYIHPDVLSEVKEFVEKGIDNKHIMLKYKEVCGFKSRKEIDTLVELLKEKEAKE
jgi:hypothetical protein